MVTDRLESNTVRPCRGPCRQTAQRPWVYRARAKMTAVGSKEEGKGSSSGGDGGLESRTC